MGNYVDDVYRHAKFYLNRFRGFGSAHAWFRAPRQKVTRLFFGPWERLQPRHAHRFWRKIRQTTRFRARKCLLGVAKKNLRFGPPFSLKTAILGPIATGLRIFFRPKTALTLHGSRERERVYFPHSNNTWISTQQKCKISRVARKALGPSKLATHCNNLL